MKSECCCPCILGSRQRDLVTFNKLQSLRVWLVCVCAHFGKTLSLCCVAHSGSKPSITETSCDVFQYEQEQRGWEKPVPLMVYPALLDLLMVFCSESMPGGFLYQPNILQCCLETRCTGTFTELFRCIQDSAPKIIPIPFGNKIIQFGVPNCLDQLCTYETLLHVLLYEGGQLRVSV